MVSDEEEARDIVQESFITVWKKMPGFNEKLNFSNWFYRILVNKCYDSLRRKKRNSRIINHEKLLDSVLILSESEPDKELENREIAEIIRGLSHHLSTKQKIVFVLSELEEFSPDEIFEMTGMSKSSIKSNLNHARRKIAGIIEKNQLK